MSINIEITTPKEISFKGSCYLVILPTISGEVGIMQGHESFVSRLCEGEIKKVLLTPVNSKAINYGFDVTPARLITGIITERGICNANKESILAMFPEKK